MDWLTDLRKTALIAAFGTTAQIVLVTANQQSTWAGLANTHGPLLLALLLLGIFALGSAASPIAFLVELYRSRAVLQIRTGLRYLALGTATVFALSILKYLFGWIHFYTIPVLFQQPASNRAIVQAVITVLSGTTYVLFLVALSRHREETQHDLREDRWLRYVATAGAIIWGLFFVFLIVGAIYMVAQYREWRELALERRVDIPSLQTMLLRRLEMEIQVVAVFVPFYIVRKSLVLAPITEATSSLGGFEAPEGPAEGA